MSRSEISAEELFAMSALFFIGGRVDCGCARSGDWRGLRLDDDPGDGARTDRGTDRDEGNKEEQTRAHQRGSMVWPPLMSRSVSAEELFTPCLRQILLRLLGLVPGPHHCHLLETRPRSFCIWATCCAAISWPTCSAFIWPSPIPTRPELRHGAFLTGELFGRQIGGLQRAGNRVAIGVGPVLIGRGEARAVRQVALHVAKLWKRCLRTSSTLLMEKSDALSLVDDVLEFFRSRSTWPHMWFWKLRGVLQHVPVDVELVLDLFSQLRDLVIWLFHLLSRLADERDQFGIVGKLGPFGRLSCDTAGLRRKRESGREHEDRTKRGVQCPIGLGRACRHGDPPLLSQ